jgi:hypothetical protein
VSADTSHEMVVEKLTPLKLGFETPSRCCTVADKQTRQIEYLVIGIFLGQTDLIFGFSLSKYVEKTISYVFPTTF